MELGCREGEYQKVEGQRQARTMKEVDEDGVVIVLVFKP